ncbi:MAG TPA: YdcF family protein [Candidatus Kapabacteria bacterium]|nr:YdcF family protein [Candidatus Kapabacteria bacterium]
MKKKMIYLLALLVLGCGIFLFTDMYLLFLEPLDTGITVNGDYGDVILVPGGGTKRGELGYSTEERLLLAVDLFKQKKRTIIVSGGSAYKGSPAVKRYLVFFSRYNIRKEYLRFEGRSQTTYDNFFNSHKMIDDMKLQEIIVCTSPYHQRRSQMIISYLGLTNFKIAKMKTSEIYQARNISQRLRNIWLITREYLAILKFKVFKR